MIYNVCGIDVLKRLRQVLGLQKSQGELLEALGRLFLGRRRVELRYAGRWSHDCSCFDDSAGDEILRRCWGSEGTERRKKEKREGGDTAHFWFYLCPSEFGYVEVKINGKR